MAQLTCQRLSVGYDGQSVLQDLTFGSGEQRLSLHRRGEWLRQEYPYENDPRLADAHQRQHFDGRWAEEKRDRLSAAADSDTKGLPGIREKIILSGCLRTSAAAALFITKKKSSLHLMRWTRCRSPGWQGGAIVVRWACSRVLLARALCATQKMLLLDEPVSGLDPKVMAEMYTLIEKLNREEGITVMLISHDVAAAVRFASHILHIGDFFVFFGTKADYLQSPQGRLFDVKKGGDSQ